MDRLGRMPVVATGFVAGLAGAAVGARDPPRLAGPRRPRAPPRRLRERDDPAAAHGRRRPVPARAARARDRARPLRLGLRRAARAVRLQPVFGSHLDGTAVVPVAARGRDHAARDPALPRRAARPADVAELLAGRADDAPAGAAARDPAPPRRPVAMGGALTSFAVMVAVMNLTGYVVVRCTGTRSRRLPDHLRAHLRDVRARPLRRRHRGQGRRRTTLVGGLLLMAVSRSRSR